MLNNTPNSKLDETIKQTLSGYEAPAEGADWNRMEQMLDNLPRSTPFKWSYVLNGFIGLAICTGAYFTYTAIKSHPAAPKVTAPAPVLETPVVSTPAPKATAPTTTSEPAPAVMSSGSNTTTGTASTPVSIPVAGNTTANTTGTEAQQLAKSKKKKDNAAAPVLDPEELKNIRVIGMGNEPVFGDMLDSSKGIVGETKEKQELKEAAKKNKSLPVGWNSFMLSNVNPDSIKSYRERVKKDSVKIE